MCSTPVRLVVLAFSAIVPLLCGCSSSRAVAQNAARDSSIKLEIIEVRRYGTSLPRISLRVTNQGSKSLKYRHAEGIFWGRVQLLWNGRTTELQHQYVHELLAVGVYIPTAVVLKPGQSFLQDIDLAGYITEGEFIYRGREKELDERKWRREVAEVSNFKVVCISDWPKAESNTALVGLLWMKK